jgi:pimeloyl-ACP methyl ester carboxylesterase
VALSVDELAAALPGTAMYFVNYRGYGGSSGRPTEAALNADAVAVYDELSQRHAAFDVVGRSLGSAVATYLASERPVRRLVLVTPFDSLAAVAQDHFRWLPVELLIRDRHDSASRAPGIRARVLMIVAADDEIVYRARSDALAQAFGPGSAQVELVAGARHNDLDSYPAYLQAVRGFLGDDAR